MKIKFCGAARTVTGSQHLLEINGKKILLDCGLYQGKREEAYQFNKHFLFEPAEIHCVILSHAHIDHCGNLPTLASKGFKGNIYSTTATRDLCAVMLQDSAHIQIRDTEFVNKKRAEKNETLFNPLYDSDDVKKAMNLFNSTSYRKKFYIQGINNNVRVTFFDAGHILGSAQILLEINENGRKINFGFSGDIGRENLPILNDPEHMGNVNFLISESTYGCKLHDKAYTMESQLEEVLKEAISRRGKIIVPAFSLGRTQELVYALSRLFSRNAIPKIPIFIDSPLSAEASKIFKLHYEYFDKETSELISKGVDIFGFSNLRYIKDVQESKALNDFKGSCLIISASGMCESGRVLHHLANNIEDINSTVLIIGFMAEHTLGRRLVESRDIPNMKVKIFGDEFTVKSKIVVLNSFSAHADKAELIDYFNKFNKNELHGIYLVHGEVDQQECLKKSLIDQNFKNVIIPEKGDEFDV
ncbi:MAG: MBL fold metallo-hydrolase RNA specificity domain-containing protein [Ignavibacteria bacterium]